MIDIYRNLQGYQASARFSVAQRRMCWKIRTHPKLHMTRRGPRWQRLTLKQDWELTDQDVSAMRRATEKQFLEAARAVQTVAELARKRGGSEIQAARGAVRM